MKKTNRLLERLREAGFSDTCVRASLPNWWTPEEGDSPSARTLVSLLLARRLSLDPESILRERGPIEFLQIGPTKFKHLRLDRGARLQALTAFGQGVSRILFSLMGDKEPPNPIPTAQALRQSILESGRSHVAFGDVLAVCWSLDIPVLHLRLFPARAKGITAMSVRLGNRYAILVARESGIPAQYMFHIAHELGHIALGHLNSAGAIVDADPNDPENADEKLIHDEEESTADVFAQELISGMPDFRVIRQELDKPAEARGSARELAQLAMAIGRQLGIDPGHVVMCFGDATGEWGLANAAAKLIPDQGDVLGTLVNKVLWGQLNTDRDEQSLDFLRAVAPA